ncbi:sensor histidine kinase [Roseococcus sp. DSY-14]|uniref:sensor histidine kinase n=1 Tax=Roseococcus sp. DSY-14 TaxID=3369650 RepID=UPI00387A8DE3
MALVLVAGIPVAVVAAANAWQKYEQSLAGISETAALVGEADRVRHATALDDQERLVRGMGKLGNFFEWPPEECTRVLSRLRLLLDARYTDLWFLDTQGRLVCNALALPPGVDFSSFSYFRRVSERRDFVLGDIVWGPASRRMVLPGAAPVTQDGRPVGVAGAAISADWLASGPSGAGLPHRTWVVDPAGQPFALAGMEAGALPEPALLAELRAAPARLTRLGQSAQGQAFAYSISAPDRGMRVLVGLPAGEAMREARGQLLQRIGELVVFLAFCLLVVLAGTELACARPLRRLAGAVRGWRPGTPFAPPHTAWDPREVDELGEALAGASHAIALRESELQAALAQSDRLVAEIHHRVKNNLQIVASLLNMQGERIGDAARRAEFAVARERVQALAALHRHLDTEAGAPVVPVAPLLRELANQVLSNATAEVEAEEITLPAEQATSLALLVTEALLNVNRHAFPAGAEGQVRLALRRQGDAARLELSDDGQGLPEDHAEGMGLSLIRGFAAHLGGEARLERGSGTRLVVEFPA